MDDVRPAPEGPDSHDEALLKLRQERDALAARVAALESRHTTRRTAGRLRHIGVALLVVLGTLSFTLSAVGWWARRNVADTNVWLDRVGTLPEDPAVRAALGTWLSDEILDLVDPASLFVEVLPERGRLLAAPLSGAVESFVRDRVDHFLASDRFQQLWLAANERAHRAAVRVLRGESDVVQARGDAVVINLVPAIDAALSEISAASPDLLGREVELPDVSVDDLPDAAIERLETALGIELDDDFGQFVVYDHGRLAALQDGLEQARRGLIISSVLTVGALGAALWWSDHRRRTLLQVLAGLAIGIALIRRLGLRGQRELLAAVPDPVNRDAAEVVTDRFLDPLLATTQTLLLLLAAVAVVVVISGPYPWAVRLRHRTAGLARDVWQSATRREAEPAAGPVGVWIRDHRGALQIGGVVIAVLVLLVANLSFLGLAALAAVVALAAFVLGRVADTVATEQAP